MSKTINKFAERVVRAIAREMRRTKRDDWKKLGGVSNVERDRYVQGLGDAAQLVRDVQAMPPPRVRR